MAELRPNPSATRGRTSPTRTKAGRSTCLALGAALLGVAVLLGGGALVSAPTSASAQDPVTGLDEVAYDATWTARHQPAVNPALAPGCGLDIGLLVDRSGSIANAGAAPQMRSAAKSFVDALSGTPSRLGVWTFGTHSAAASGDPAHPSIGLTDVSGANARSGATALKAVIDSIPIGEGAATNWDAAFRAVHTASTTTGDAPDLLVVLTDGQPTVYGDAKAPDPRTEDADIDAGIASANLVKGDGTRVFAVGIGAGVDQAALSLISGGTAWNGSNLATADYALTSFGQLATTLRAAVSELCGGTVTVQKVVRYNDGTQRPEADWSFAFDGPDDPTWSTVVKTDADGLAQLALRSVEVERVAIAEVPQSGFSLLVDEIVCDNAAGPNPHLTRNDDGVAFDLGPTDIVSCSFPNLRALEPEPETTTTTSTTTPPTTTPPTTAPPTTPTTPDPTPPSTAPVTTVTAAPEVLGTVQAPISATGSLPRTGADTGRLAFAGTCLLAGGALTTTGLRRRQHATM